jgi:hypothetical protein
MSMQAGLRERERSCRRYTELTTERNWNDSRYLCIGVGRKLDLICNDSLVGEIVG